MIYTTRIVLRAAAALGLGAVLCGCTGGSGAPPKFGPLRYADGSTTLNDRCPVKRNPLNAKVDRLWVNEHPVGFC